MNKNVKELCWELDQKSYLLEEIADLGSIVDDYISNVDEAVFRGNKKIGQELKWKMSKDKIIALQNIMFEKLDEYRNWSDKLVEDGFKDARKSDK